MAAKVPIALAHGSVPSAFASHEDVNGTLNAITLPQALALLDLTADHTLASIVEAWEEAEASPNDDDITVPTCEHHRAASFGEEREGETHLPYSFDDEKAL